MEQVYKMKLWGKNNTRFYSGEGSHNPKIVNPYLNVVADFLNSFKNPLTVCDLGCGDFNIGKHLVDFTKHYFAIDIVPQLIKHNKEKYQKPNLEFLCLDISKEDIPEADCVILRQVLQHLSNEEVLSITKKLKNYKYVILTEHLPNGEFTPNKDIISGQGIRLKKQSGIDLLCAPYYLEIKGQKELSKIHLENTKGIIKTVCYKTR
ncbi:class I SAM-dependent methyltransferase [Polaribacter aquimarinus]|uniref:SAM-dependent methyltransferase n=1 Tax=Polaribacter aquimarinus TaxID=2100726 RepID=A0A2U2JD26_9FLAO|nr:class I SAM-dependent methyltransferase [Polaribacter aquimarinus]PWG06224.1 SAM-dependent methyltransferase [Polaribacter aquimarinus]